MHDPQDVENQKICHIIGVGWDKRIHIWQDEKKEVVETFKTLPQNNQQGHATDIMSVCCYYKDNI